MPFCALSIAHESTILLNSLFSHLTAEKVENLQFRSFNWVVCQISRNFSSHFVELNELSFQFVKWFSHQNSEIACRLTTKLWRRIKSSNCKCVRALAPQNTAIYIELNFMLLQHFVHNLADYRIKNVCLMCMYTKHHVNYTHRSTSRMNYASAHQKRCRKCIFYSAWQWKTTKEAQKL